MLCNNRIKKRGTGRWILEWGIDLVIWKICTFQVPQPNGGRKTCLGNQDKKGVASPNNLKDPITSSFIQIKLQHSSVSLLDANLQRCEFYHTLSTTSPSLWSTVTVANQTLPRAACPNTSLPFRWRIPQPQISKGTLLRLLLRPFPEGEAEGRGRPLPPLAARGRPRPARPPQEPPREGAGPADKRDKKTNKKHNIKGKKVSTSQEMPSQYPSPNEVFLRPC